MEFADTKNSVGLVGCIEEVAHNAIAVYWNPVESSAKVLSTGIKCFTNRKSFLENDRREMLRT